MSPSEQRRDGALCRVGKAVAGMRRDRQLPELVGPHLTLSFHHRELLTALGHRTLMAFGSCIWKFSSFHQTSPRSLHCAGDPARLAPSEAG